ncbi:MAG TPA: DUF4147 domain-containing protein [Bdellovibrionota bacterium]|nr:DUF4147 domain-containing protein [Bdellovibrionota bacterium]
MSAIPDLIEHLRTALHPGPYLAKLASGWNLDPARTHCVAIGKAAVAQAAAFGRFQRCWVVSKKGAPILGDHPIAGPRSYEAGRRLLDELGSVSPEETVVFLISGGASALAEVPLAPWSEAEVTELGRSLIEGARPIGAANPLRALVSAHKAGGLAAACPAERQFTVWTSDVPADRVEWVGSGPTVEWNPADHLPPATPHRLIEWSESPAYREHRERIHRALEAKTCRYHRLMGPEHAERAATSWARERRWARHVVAGARGMPGPDCVEAFVTAIQKDPPQGPTLWLSAGESPFDPPPGGFVGKGGRCTEWVARTARALEKAGISGPRWKAGAYATDEDDGTTGTAGCWNSTPIPARETVTNVMDLRFVAYEEAGV